MLKAKFNLEGLNKANPNFDEDKFLHQNAHYIKNMDTEKLYEFTKPFFEKAGIKLEDYDKNWIIELLKLEQDRCRLLAEFPEVLDYFFAEPESYEEKGYRKFIEKNPEAKKVLESFAEVIEKAENLNHEVLDSKIRDFTENMGMKMGQVCQPVRLALTGRTCSPGLFEMIELLGKEKTVLRIKKLIKTIN